MTILKFVFNYFTIYSILFINSVFTIPVTEDKQIIKRSPKVIIVGAGLAGLGAGIVLLQNGIQDVTILEAMDRPGGRINYIELGGNLGGVDLGAHWIHGQASNIIYTIGNSLNLVKSSGDNEKNVLVKPGGQFVDLGKTYLEIFEYIVEGLEHLSEEEKKQNFEQFLNRRMDPLIQPLNLTKSDADALKYLAGQSFCDLEACNDVKELSLRNPTQYGGRDGDKLVEWKEGGMGTIIKLLLGIHKLSHWKNLKLTNHIELSKRVSRIDYFTLDGKVRVQAESGKIYTADYVIFTGSLNVLKSKHDKIFSPTLPRRKVEVIESLGMDVVDKIFLVFDKPWWPENITGFALLKYEKYPYQTWDWGNDIISFDAESHNKHVLCGWIVGDGARAMERASISEVKQVSMRILRKYLSHLYDIPEPIKVVRTRWWNNQDVIGSYSFNHVNSDHIKDPRQILSQPVNNIYGKPVLLFAGEATNADNYATAHGGLESGFREARRIIKLIK